MEKNDFEIEYKEGLLKVETIHLPGQVLFRVNFSNGLAPLVVCKATDFNQEKFWTSVPEGRQPLAEETGHLIEQYFLTNRK